MSTGSSEPLAAGHYPADGLARLPLPATVEVVDVDGRHLVVDVTHEEGGAVPCPWKTLLGTDDNGRRWTAELSKEGNTAWHAGYIFDTAPLDVSEVRRLACSDCGSGDNVRETEIDGCHQTLCAACRSKWGGFLSTTYGGGR